jgi:hypothetical protein
MARSAKSNGKMKRGSRGTKGKALTTRKKNKHIAHNCDAIDVAVAVAVAVAVTAKKKVCTRND